MTDLIKPRTTIIGKPSFIRPLSTQDSSQTTNKIDTSIMKTVLTTNQVRYIDTRPISEPSESRSEYNRLPELKTHKTKVTPEEAKRRSRITSGMKALRGVVSENEIQPRFPGNVLYPQTVRYRTVIVGEDVNDTSSVYTNILSEAGSDLYY